MLDTQSFRAHLTRKSKSLYVVLPGLMGSSAELASHTVPKSDSILTLDYTSGHTGSYAKLCDDLISIVNLHAKDYEISLVGYSMGGRVLISCLDKLSPIVSSILFISCGIPLHQPKGRYQKIKFEQMVLTKLNQLSNIDFCNWWYQLPLYTPLSLTDNFTEFIENRSKNLNKDHIQWLIMNYSALHMPINWKPQIKTASKLVYWVGEHDKKYQIIASNLTKYLPTMSIKSIKEKGHLCWKRNSIH